MHLRSLTDQSRKHNIKHVGDLIQPFFDKLESNQKILQSGERSIIGQRTGLAVFDEFTGGDQPGICTSLQQDRAKANLFLRLTMAKGGAMAGDPSNLSLEMDDDMQIARLISDMSNVYNHKIQRATVDAIDWERLIRHGRRDQEAANLS
jgi:replicative DNA helicase